MLYLVISYDISEDRSRTKVAKLLEDHGVRVQYSVFECLLDEATLSRLRLQLQDLIDYETDSIRIYRLCRRCQPATEILGRGTMQQEEAFRIF